MAYKRFPIFLLLVSVFLFGGCTGSFVTTENSYESWVDFSYFQNRFDALPDGITRSDWQNIPQDSGNTIHSAVLSCKDDQCQHNLDITANSDGKILNISLQSEKTDNSDSCFAEVSYHVFCSMGFQEKDGKGHTAFADADAFYSCFQMFLGEDVDRSMWINRHEVNYTYLSNSEICRFIIHYNIRE